MYTLIVLLTCPRSREPILGGPIGSSGRRVDTRMDLVISLGLITFLLTTSRVRTGVRIRSKF